MVTQLLIHGSQTNLAPILRKIFSWRILGYLYPIFIEIIS